MTQNTTNLSKVEHACQQLRASARAVTFTAVADETGISRTTLYRNPEIRAVITQHRSTNTDDPHTISGLVTDLSHLRIAVEELADRVRKQEERIRQLERHHQKRTVNRAS